MNLPSATLLNYYHLCKRKMWLSAHQIQMEHTSTTVSIGKSIGENTYNRRAKKWKELDLGNAKIDYFDPQNNTVREVKKSPKLEHVHIAQVQYYLYLLQKRGINDCDGIIEYPKQRKTTKVVLTAADIANIEGVIEEINQIIDSNNCPSLIKKSYCKSCSYFDFCFI